MKSILSRSLSLSSSSLDNEWIHFLYGGHMIVIQVTNKFYLLSASLCVFVFLLLPITHSIIKWSVLINGIVFYSGCIIFEMTNKK